MNARGLHTGRAHAQRSHIGHRALSPQRGSRGGQNCLFWQYVTTGLMLCATAAMMLGPIGAEVLQAAPFGRHANHLTSIGQLVSAVDQSVAGQLTIVPSPPPSDRQEGPSGIRLAFLSPTSDDQMSQTMNPLAWLVVGLSVAIALALAALGMIKFLRLVGYLGERRRVTTHLSGPAYYDQLTGLPSGRLFQILLKQAVLRAARSERVVALLLFKLDQLRVVTQQHGHTGGDVAIRVLAARVKSCLRTTDATARLGGDQFAVILENIQSPEEAAAFAQKMFHTVVLPLTLQGHEILINTSIGIALYPIDSRDGEGLVKRAEAAMGAATTQGLPIQFHAAHLNDQVFERLTRDNATTVGGNS